MKQYLTLLIVAFYFCNATAQGLLSKAPQQFTHQDTLRGSSTPERVWWDLKYYHLDIKVNPKDSTIVGTNTIKYTVLKTNNTMQIDLQEPMQIQKIIQEGKELNFKRDGNAFFVNLKTTQNVGDIKEIKIFFGGRPKIAIRPPWDGGITWQKDKNGNDFIASTCQGIGASVWWPNKDHMSDEVENMLISVNIPGNLTDVSNGRLQSVIKQKDGTKTFNWYVANPINNYGVNINIGDYVHFWEKYKGEKGELDCNYYVLRDNLEVAKKQFKDVARMLTAFEYWFGPYPFYEDSYKLVEAPYLGMEHQSSITYGNGYKNGYLGTDLSHSGWGLLFDFIIIHESGHEWFANNITYKDIADMWIHESFTNYSESLFVDYFYGKEAGYEYLRGLRKNIKNDIPIIGTYNVNSEGSSDMYYKGANMLHTLRQLVDNDEKWRSILRGLNSTFYHQTVSTHQIEEYLSQQTGMQLQPFFDQYLRTIMVPTLEYFFTGDELNYRWINCVSDFEMPVKVNSNGIEILLKPTTKIKSSKVSAKNKSLLINENFYVATLNITK